MGTDDRPTVEEWRTSWDRARAAVPAGDPPSRSECDDLLVASRELRRELLPSPYEAVDAVVEEWLHVAQGLGLECHDVSGAADRLEELEILADEVETGLADSDPANVAE